MTAYVAYFRVSTSKQEKSGLGLASQRSKLLDFMKHEDKLIAEFIETQSGRNDKREELWKAINHAKKHSAKILIAKLDRFSRKVSFISRIMEEGIGLVVADMPDASDFQLHIFAALAQEERRLISERTKAALAEAKKRGVVLGVNSKKLSKQNKLEAKNYAIGLAPIISPLINNGMSYSAISRYLNHSNTDTAKGGRFYPQTVKNIIKRLQQLDIRNAS